MLGSSEISNASRLLLGATLLVLVGCQGCPLFVPAGSCRRNVDCQTGQLCVDQRCVKACNGNQDCGGKDQACIEGYCAPVPAAQCAAGSDCTRPGACQLAAGASCSGGTCRYQSKPAGESCAEDNLCTSDERCDGDGVCAFTEKFCLEPPAAECVDSNSVFRSYGNPGHCDPATGDCQYPPLDRPCANCSTTCAARCAGIACSALNGGCQSNGVCVPEEPPRCEYQVAAENTACSLPTDPLGTFSGHCFGGQCAGCTDATGCTTPPGAHPECFSAACRAGVCAYDPLPQISCEVARCADGYLYDPRSCGQAGDCPEMTRQSCHGFRCNPDGLTCLTACGGDGDCVPGAYCDTSNRCAGLLEDGESCAGLGNERCLSGYCDGALCCAGGDCCNQAIDCPASYAHASVCSDSSTSTPCQGTRFDATCRSYVCASTPVDDDSGCNGLPHVCTNHLAARVCSSVADQSAPICATTCSSDGDCESGYTCNQTTGACDRVPGLGDACTGTGQGSCNSNLKCQNNICCQANGPTCCTTASSCAAGLTCNSTAFACHTTCGNYTADRCADSSGTYCLNNACGAKHDASVACQNNIECRSGSCVEGVCCGSACDSVCASCRGAVTGASDGICAAIVLGGQDNAPTPLCTASGDGCGGGSCACEGGGSGPTRCKRAVGQDCATDAECATGICECANEQCTARKCSRQWCNACELTANGSSCTAGLGTSAAVDDPPSCTGTSSCYSGQCRRDNGAACNADGDCGSNNCECGDATCTAGGKKCAAASCGVCEYTLTGSACDGDLAPSVTCNDGNACTRTDTCQGGSCVGSNPVSCTSTRGCEQPTGSCNTSDGSCTFAPRGSGYLCRASAGVCDVGETCGAAAGDCPADAKSTTLCRDSAGECDVADFCDGSGNNCPGDTKRNSGFGCTADSNPCTLDQCDGSSSACQHPAGNGGAVCRASTGGCDAAEQCTGSSTSCPADTGGSDYSCGFCQKCWGGNCVPQTASEDVKGECGDYSCGSFVYGWNGSTCYAAAATGANGNCNGGGGCSDFAASCSNQGAALASCISASCMKKPGNYSPETVACVAGSAPADNNTPDKICFTGNVVTTECHDEGSSGDTYYYHCQAGGECYNYYYSCPMLYTWIGEDFAFESDMYTAGTLGLKLGNGYRKPDPHDAYVLRHQPVARGGEIDLRIVEELEELDYLDEAHLFGVDVPADRELVAWANNVPGAPTEIVNRLVTIGSVHRPLVSALHLNTGNDVAALLATSDENYLMLSEIPSRCYWNTIEADLGDLVGASIVKLVVDGRSRFSSTPEGIRNKLLNDPNGWQTTLEVVDASGTWVQVPRNRVTLVKPKEYPRVMAIDITGIFPTGDHRVRMSWFAKTYLDAIWIDTTPNLPFTVTEAMLDAATLVRHGFSNYTGSDLRTYYYSQLGPVGWPLPPGAYTSYGNVMPLLAVVDDRFVIFGPGDEVALLFLPPAPPAAGLKRIYALQTTGFYKQSSLVDGGTVPFTVSPLPFHAMSNYPYDPLVEHYPDDAEHQQYLLEWNTRLVP